MTRAIKTNLWILALLGCLSGCIIEDRSSPPPTTCELFHDFLAACTANCDPTWDCEENYASLSPYDQDVLDACSDCLVANLDEGVCLDCAVPSDRISSCRGFMADFLGMACW